MAACEWCWQRASAMALHLGGSVADEYRRTMSEQEALSARAECPEARHAAESRAEGEAP
jgi:hypothetical protein